MKNNRIARLAAVAVLGAGLTLTGCVVGTPPAGESTSEAIDSALTKAWGDLHSAADDFTGKVGDENGAGADKLKQLAGDLGSHVASLGTDITGGSTDSWDKVTGWVSDIDGHISDAANEVSDGTVEAWNTLKDKIEEVGKHL